MFSFYRPQRSCGNVMFLHLCQSFCSQRGCLPHTPRVDTPGQTSPWADNPWADTPLPMGRHPTPGQTPPPHGQTPPWADTPSHGQTSPTPGQTPSSSWTDTPWHTPLPQADTPLHSACWDTVNKRAVRTPLECILVFLSFFNEVRQLCSGIGKLLVVLCNDTCNASYTNHFE